ncbi:hypothetical protein GPECTOR_20g438 [Gonium pectorale]|uniref:phytol kinase n=1 Tax=Gonium pectorale TaxID=33097 RepID=A0A150GID9_GONPE|nr:hypothetical protein GPECTOR_20g438 [Gonium pectorale]|eukprot:KXZ49582.1 hypothetical protein GPECTOR_20g438 [Gonium pectorale]
MSSRRARTGGNGSSRSPANPDPLPPIVRDALQRLPRAIEPLFSSRAQLEQDVGGLGSPLARLRTAELRSIQQHVSVVRNFLSSAAGGAPSASAAVLAHATTRQALLCLLAASLRLRRHDLSGEGGSRQELCAEIAEGVAVTVTFAMPSCPPPDHPGRGLRLPLLRSDALHAAARQLAELVEPLEARAAAAVAGTAGTPPAGAGSPAPVVAGQGAMGRKTAVEECPTLTEPAAAYAAAVLSLVYRIVIVASDFDFEFKAPGGVQLLEALAAALEGSQVLEHAGRALLLLRMHVRATRLSNQLDQAALWANTTHCVLWQFISLLHIQADEQGGSASADMRQLADRLQAVLSGRCAQHAALCLGLAVLCDTDGGPAYGLPPELDAPLLPSEVRAYASGSRVMSAEAIRQLRGMLGMLQLRLRPGVGAAAPPPGRRGALEVTMRVGWLAVASARALAAKTGGGGGGGGAGSSGEAGGSGGAVSVDAKLAAQDVLPVALEALQCARRHLLLGTRPEAEGAVAEATRWWRLTAAVAADVLPHARFAPELTDFFDLLTVCWRDLLFGDGSLSLPPKAPPALAAALEGGVLRCLEGLIRCAGREPPRPEASDIARAWVGLGTNMPLFLTLLLAYGEPRQAAALVGTLRKLLRIVGPPYGTMPAFMMRACDYVLDVVSNWDAAELMAAGMADQEGREGPSPASQQLVRLTFCAACEWLPRLSQMVLANRTSGLTTLCTICGWLPVLADCCDRAATVSDDGGWRALLLEEVGAVPLLDFALHVVPRLDELDEQELVLVFLCQLVLGCCSVAAVYTGQGPTPAHAAVGAPEQSELEPLAAAAAGAVAEPFRDAVGALPWRPELLREAAARIRAYEPPELELHEDADDLAAYLERGGRGAYDSPVDYASPLTSVLLPPADVRRLLPGRCANPACANLEGDSEADLRLKACAGCGAVGYCCRPCQTAHWRAGHKKACGRGRGGGA